MSPELWYKNKRAEYLRFFNKEWDHINFGDSCLYETMMRMAVEKKFFGLTTFEEDVMIANAIMIRDKVSRRCGTNV